MFFGFAALRHRLAPRMAGLPPAAAVGPPLCSCAGSLLELNSGNAAGPLARQRLPLEWWFWALAFGAGRLANARLGASWPAVTWEGCLAAGTGTAASHSPL